MRCGWVDLGGRMVVVSADEDVTEWVSMEVEGSCSGGNDGHGGMRYSPFCRWFAIPGV